MENKLSKLIELSLEEDLPQGDLTTEALGINSKKGRAKLLAKQDLVLSGISAFENTILVLDPEAQLKWHFSEGQAIYNQQIVCTIQGDLLQILKAERVALNFIMHLSGIATFTNKFVKALGPRARIKILDTRKTLPAYRELEKKAVVHGGGHNHRMNLSSAILIKDNHIQIMGSIKAAVEKVRSNYIGPIEVEAGTLEEVRECVSLNVERILLDNMNNQLLKEALELIPSSIKTEASGNMSLERVSQLASYELDFISVGALTHSAPSADLSLDFIWEN